MELNRQLRSEEARDLLRAAIERIEFLYGGAERAFPITVHIAAALDELAKKQYQRSIDSTSKRV